MLCLRGFELYSRWVPLIAKIQEKGDESTSVTNKITYKIGRVI